MMTRRNRIFTTIGIIVAGLAAAAYSGSYLIAKYEYNHLTDCENHAVMALKINVVRAIDMKNADYSLAGDDWGHYQQELAYLNANCSGAVDTTITTPS